MATAAEPALLTAEEFASRPDPGYPEELVEGRIVAMPPPGAQHGKVCATLAWLFGAFVRPNHLGHLLGNDAGVITRRDPDSVRGADLSFYSYAGTPQGALPADYLRVPPDFVAEVLSPHDRWPSVVKKVGEYLEAGVGVVWVVDPDQRSVHVFTQDRTLQTFAEDQVLTLPGPLAGFQVRVAELFE